MSSYPTQRQSALSVIVLLAEPVCNCWQRSAASTSHATSQAFSHIGLPVDSYWLAFLQVLDSGPHIIRQVFCQLPVRVTTWRTFIGCGAHLKRLENVCSASCGRNRR